MKTLNLTQHNATAEQLEAGVIEPTPEHKAEIAALLTFDSIPSAEEMQRRAWALVDIASQYLEYVKAAMIGGAPFFRPVLEEALATIWWLEPVEDEEYPPC